MPIPPDLIDPKYAPITARAARTAAVVWIALAGASLAAFLSLPFEGRPLAVLAIVAAGSISALICGRLWDYAERLDHRAETARRGR